MPRTRSALLALLIAGALAAPAYAQGRGAPSQEELIKRRDAKLAEAWVSEGGWITDLQKALTEAKEGGKLILAYFSRSYAG
jgi:hypothetical protein